MIPVNTTATSVKKNEIPNTGFTTVQNVVFLLIPNVLLGTTHISKETHKVATCFEMLHINLIVKTTDINDLYQCAQCNFQYS